MKINHCPSIRVRSLPLAACLVAALAAPHADGTSVRRAALTHKATPQAPLGSTVLPVTSCLDDGSAGTLRSVVAEAVSGDTVDMTQLACGTITLASGAIAVGDVTLQGPGANALAIDGANADRVFVHSDAGTLTITDVTITHGHVDTGTSFGGCIYSSGPISMNRATVTSCSTSGGSGFFGGGGGLFVYGDLSITDSTLSDNVASRVGSGNYFVVAGAALVVGNASIVNSTISGNAAQDLAGSGGYHTYGGGLVVNGTLTVRNSTIAFNAAGHGGGGIFSLGYPLELQSSIVADNTATYSGYFSADIGGYGTMTGASNLIVASDIGVPPDTLNADPQLLALADNGGPTPTHAFASASPAIDTGNNAASLPFDQRGDGYLRVSGLGADIGAFEYQQTFAVPTVAKNFAPDTIIAGSTSTLTITLNNPNPIDATLTADFADDFPSQVTVADPSDAATTCPAGSVIADAGAVTLAAGAAIPAAGSCTITVTVTSADAGAFTNTIPAGALETDQGSDTSPASAILTVTAQAPSVAKAFAPDSIPAGESTTLTITLANANPLAATLNADLEDALPASISVADPPNASTTCAGGTVAAEPGGSAVTLASGAAIPPNGTCAITVAITAVIPGVFTNTIPTGALRTSLGNSADAAQADLIVTTSDRIFADGFDQAPGNPAAISTSRDR